MIYGDFGGFERFSQAKTNPIKADLFSPQHCCVVENQFEKTSLS